MKTFPDVSRGDDEDGGADADALEQPLGVGDPHPDAAVRGRVADRGGVRGAVNADARRAQAYPAGAERVARAGRDRLQAARPGGVGRIPPRVPPLDDDVEAAERRRIAGLPGRNREDAPVAHGVVEVEPVGTAADDDYGTE